MGSQQQVASRFADQNKWMPLAQTSRKQLIQNKLSRQIVEKHFLKNVQWDEVKQDSIIFQWRKDPATTNFCIQLLQIRQLKEDQEAYCMSSCKTTDKETDLLVYTQHIFKLYEQNPKCLLDQKDQLTVFKGIIEGVDMLSQKFGQFVVTKDMVGYNAAKRGKAWVNQNFCVNKIQTKRAVKNTQERLKWQKQVIESLLNLCKLCSIDKNMKNCKFYKVMELIMRHRLYKFSSFRDFGPFKAIDLSQGMKDGKTTREYRKSQQEISSENRSDKSRVKIFSKTFQFPVVKVHSPQKNLTTLDPQYNTSFAVPVQNLTLGGKKKAAQGIVSQPSSINNSNQVQVKNHGHLNHLNNQTFLNDANDYNRKNRQSNPVKNLYGKPNKSQKPEHYALLEELQDSRSSRASSKMINKQMIQMVDSLVMVQNKESEGSHPRRYDMVMEESVIIRHPRR